MLLRRFPNILDAQLGSLCQAFGVECKQSEMVMVHPVSTRRYRPVIARVTEVIDGEPQALGSGVFHTLGQRPASPSDIVYAPVTECAGWGIGVLDDQCKAPRSGRWVGPFQWRRDVIAVSRVTSRDQLTILKGWTSQ